MCVWLPCHTSNRLPEGSGPPNAGLVRAFLRSCTCLFPTAARPATLDGINSALVGLVVASFVVSRAGQATALPGLPGMAACPRAACGRSVACPACAPPHAASLRPAVSACLPPKPSAPLAPPAWAQGLLGVAATDVRPELLAAANWEALPDALPVIALAFVYQNVVPVITTSLEGNVGKIRWAARAASCKLPMPGHPPAAARGWGARSLWAEHHKPQAACW